MSRFAAALIAVTFVVAAGPASAQQMGAGPPMPLAVDLAKVPVGSWAEYTMAMGKLPSMKMKMALVSRSATGTSLETSVEGGMMASAGGKMVMQAQLGPGGEKDGKAEKLTMQIGGNDPMEVPIQMAGQTQFTKPDPKTLVGSETVKVSAGSFKTKHYRDKTPTGDAIDYWVSDKVPPLGVVKIESEQKGTPAIQGPIKIELIALGSGAKPAVTKPAKPFDQAAMIQQMTGGKAGPGRAGAAPAAPPASAAPAAPAKK